MSEVKKIATRQSYGEALKEYAEAYPNLVVLDADLIRTSSFLTQTSRAQQRPAFSRQPIRTASMTAASQRAT